eukprot:Platyproteum_vivax@DN10601_c0_g1_i1.p1
MQHILILRLEELPVDSCLSIYTYICLSCKETAKVLGVEGSAYRMFRNCMYVHFLFFFFFSAAIAYQQMEEVATNNKIDKKAIMPVYYMTQGDGAKPVKLLNKPTRMGKLNNFTMPRLKRAFNCKLGWLALGVFFVTC